jgi:FkbM family methyltransferase
MFRKSAKLAIDAPVLATAKPADVPLIDAENVNAFYPSRRFIHDSFEGVHDRDFEFFGRLGDDIVFCDIGANIGQTVVTLKHMKSKATLHSFEINPVCWPILERRAAKYTGSFVFHPYGLGERSGAFELYVPVNGDAAVSTLGTLELAALQTPHLTNLLQDMIPGPEWRVIKTRVEVKTFDSLGIEPDFVKVDVEGYEAGVLRGMLKTIKRKRPAFLIENTNPKSVEAVLTPLGYLPCGWERETQSVHISHGKYGNSLYLHTTDILELMSARSSNKATQLKLGSNDRLDQRDFGMLTEPVDKQFVTETFRVFLGVDPTPEQLELHGKADASRLAMRNRFMRYIIDNNA